MGKITERLITALSVVSISFLMIAIFTLESYPVDCKSPEGSIVLKAIREGMCPEGYEGVKTEESPTKTIQTVDCKDPYGHILKNIRKGMCPKAYEEIKHEVTTQYPVSPTIKERVTTLPQKSAKNEISEKIEEEKPSLEQTKEVNKNWKNAVYLAVLIIFLILAVYSILGHEKEKRRLRALKLSDIDNMNGIEFEHYVGKLLRHRGFKIQVTKSSGDFGVDIIAQKKDIKYAVQVKRNKDHLSRNAISDAVAGKQHYGCNASMVVTNSHFTKGAKELARSTGCELIDRDTLTDWILHFQNSNDNVS